ncbi:MAG TPA: FtsX-like permease family protein, partial [Pyrinomonadaceae bacterium]|nr:FtsX-like permease family protein [Pyrinomonadaceae bacterium]
LFSQAGSRGMMDSRKSYASTIYGLFIVVALVLLIACVNLANLLLARAALRGAEIKVRLAVGAGRLRLVRQLLTESLLLATLGGIAGVLFAFWASRALSAFTTDQGGGLLPKGLDLTLNWRVLVFTLGVSLLTGVLFGLAPAWRATSLDLSSTLKRSGRTTRGMSRLSKGLLVAQVAVSGLLLVGAGLFIRTLYNLQRVELGFNPENLLVFRLQPKQAGYKDEQLVQFYQQVFDRLDHLTGVRAATFARVELVANSNWFDEVLLPGETAATAASHEVMLQLVRENYFATMEIPVLRGRQFTVADDGKAPVAIVNQAFAQQFFPGEDVLGKRVRFTDSDRELEVVGVVANTKYGSQREKIEPMLYRYWQQYPDALGEMHFALRTTGDPSVLATRVREVIRGIDDNLPITQLGTQSARAETTLGPERLYARLFGIFGFVALALAGIGLFGVLAYSVNQRTKEIGVRMAFGAQVKNVILMVVWQGMKLVLLGLAVSSVIGYALVRLLNSEYFDADSWQQKMKGQLYGVTLSDPLTLIVIALLLSLVALIACWLPARRAAKVDPLVALRYE